MATRVNIFAGCCYVQKENGGKADPRSGLCFRLEGYKVVAGGEANAEFRHAIYAARAAMARVEREELGKSWGPLYGSGSSVVIG